MGKDHNDEIYNEDWFNEDFNPSTYTYVDESHYKHMKIEPWDYILANRLGFLEGNILKYISRWRTKNGIPDLIKARNCLNKLIEFETNRQKEKDNGTT